MRLTFADLSGPASGREMIGLVILGGALGPLGALRATPVREVGMEWPGDRQRGLQTLGAAQVLQAMLGSCLLKQPCGATPPKPGEFEVP